MNYSAYLKQVTARLTGLGFSVMAPPSDLAPRLGTLLSRTEDWGQLLLLLPAAPAVPADGEGRQALVNAVAAWVRNFQRQQRIAQYAIVLFPFERRVEDRLSDAVRALQQEDADRQWGVMPWAADLEIELIDRHPGFPRISEDVVRALTEVPRAAAQEALRQAMAPRIGNRTGLPQIVDIGAFPVTRVILAATIAYYVWTAMIGSNAGVLAALTGPDTASLLRWGANSGWYVLVYGQQWRLLSHVMLHGGLLHLGMNMWALWNVGRHVEMIYGSIRTAFIYVVAGVAGGIASAVIRPVSVTGVGASGAILGLMGAMVYFAIAMRGRVEWRTFLGPVVINLAFGFFLGGIIDNYAHVGGFIGGLLAAAIAGAPGERAPWRNVAMAGTGLLVVAILAGWLPMTMFR